MKKAIVTRYFGPGAVRGSRIQAKAEGVGAIMYNFEHEDSHGTRHTLAAKALAEKYGWSGLYVAGGMPDGTGNVYVCVGDKLPVEYAPTYFGYENDDWFYIPEKPR